MLASALWFFLPAGLANGIPVVVARMPGLRNWLAPMDFHKYYKGQRIFGANKTWRGLFAGIVIATLVIAWQKYMFTHNLWALEHSWFDYRPAIIWWLGPLFAIGALGADALESFFKRQLGIKPGHSWFPYDQIDYILGGCVLSSFIVRLSVSKYFLILIVWFGVHLFVSYIGYLLHFKDRPI